MEIKSFINVIKKPHPHILVESRKKIHGWWPGRRECTAERLLLNPYNGCSFNCLFCYANALGWGHFKRFREQNIVTVCRDFDQVTAKTLDRLPAASCGYLSPVSDPFQPVNQKYRLSEKLIQVFVERNLPIEIITKGVIPRDVLRTMSRQRHSFAQVSILTPHEVLRKKLVRGRGAATTTELFDNLKRIKQQGLFAVLRIDPIIPFVTDNPDDLKNILTRAARLSVDHVVASVLDIPLNIRADSLRRLRSLNPEPPVPFEELFGEKIGYSLQARLDYRLRIFEFLSKESKRLGFSFALCMEFEKVNRVVEVPTANGKIKKVREVGLNARFMRGCLNCEGQDIPVYVKNRDGFRFKPAFNCAGNCLNCATAACGFPGLAMGRSVSGRKDFSIRDYLALFKGKQSNNNT